MKKIYYTKNKAAHYKKGGHMPDYEGMEKANERFITDLIEYLRNGDERLYQELVLRAEGRVKISGYWCGKMVKLYKNFEHYTAALKERDKAIWAEFLAMIECESQFNPAKAISPFKDNIVFIYDKDWAHKCRGDLNHEMFAAIKEREGICEDTDKILIVIPKDIFEKLEFLQIPKNHN